MINEEFFRNLPKNAGLDGFEFYVSENHMKRSVELYLKTKKPIEINSRDLAAGNEVDSVVTQLTALLSGVTYFKSDTDKLQKEIEELKAQVRELERYKTHFDLEKEKLQAEPSESST